MDLKIIQSKFREVLGLISIEEIVSNRELSIRVELLNSLLSSRS